MAARTTTLAAAFAAVLATPALAAAACPPGSWFCEEPEQPAGPAPDGRDPESAETPPPERDSTVRDEPASESDPPEPTEPRRSRAWPPVVYPPSHRLRKATYRSRPESDRRFGLNGHANIVVFDNDPYRHRRSSMQGIGAAFRFRPIPMLGLDLGPEILGGRDYNGDERFEVGALANALLFLTPSKRFEFHLLAGFGLSAAFVREDFAGDSDIRRYGYAGVDFGVGFDFYVTPRVALGVEALVFIRSRGDDEPREFVDPKTHRATNTSAAPLLRPGATVYF